MDGNQLSELTNGDWVEYPTSISAPAARRSSTRGWPPARPAASAAWSKSASAARRTVVGSFSVGNTGGWTTWKTVPANISKQTGTQNVYLVFSSSAGRQPAVREPALLQLPDGLSRNAVDVAASRQQQQGRGPSFRTGHGPFLRSGIRPGPAGQLQLTLVGAPLVPLALKPTETEAPGAMVPSYGVLVTVTLAPDWV